MMHKLKSFPLRLSEADRERAKKLAVDTGCSENRLYTELIHEGLLIREQMAYMTSLRSMKVSSAEGLALLDKAPDIEPEPEDRLPDEVEPG